jgi:hypothetical protein
MNVNRKSVRIGFARYVSKMAILAPPSGRHGKQRRGRTAISHQGLVQSEKSK